MRLSQIGGPPIGTDARCCLQANQPHPPIHAMLEITVNWGGPTFSPTCNISGIHRSHGEPKGNQLFRGNTISRNTRTNLRTRKTLQRNTNLICLLLEATKNSWKGINSFFSMLFVKIVRVFCLSKTGQGRAAAKLLKRPLWNLHSENDSFGCHGRKSRGVANHHQEKTRALPQKGDGAKKHFGSAKEPNPLAQEKDKYS